jgi:hypothetical protein
VRLTVVVAQFFDFREGWRFGDTWRLGGKPRYNVKLYRVMAAPGLASAALLRHRLDVQQPV